MTPRSCSSTPAICAGSRAGSCSIPGMADDVVQRAWIEALRSGRAGRGGASRAWLAGIVRNLSRQTRREEARRVTREQVASRPEAVPSALEAADRLETLRRLIEAVQSLDEPYKSAITMRFFDDLPPRKIARRLGVPVDTVRTRVRRGVTILRKRLDGGTAADRRRFLSALLPLAGPLPLPFGIGSGVSAETAFKWSGMVGMSSKTQLGIAAAVLIGVSFDYLEGCRGRSRHPAPASAELACGRRRAAGCPRERSAGLAAESEHRRRLAPAA